MALPFSQFSCQPLNCNNTNDQKQQPKHKRGFRGTTDLSDMLTDAAASCTPYLCVRWLAGLGWFCFD
jgi:hypothetical protein